MAPTGALNLGCSGGVGGVRRHATTKWFPTAYYGHAHSSNFYCLELVGVVVREKEVRVGVGESVRKYARTNPRAKHLLAKNPGLET